MDIKAVELDTNKVYSILVEVGDMDREAVLEHLQEVKTLYEGLGIKAVYSATKCGFPIVTINEILPAVKEW